MKVKELIEILSREDQDAEVHLFTGWEMCDPMPVTSVQSYPDGYIKRGGPALVLHQEGACPPEWADPNYVQPAPQPKPEPSWE